MKKTIAKKWCTALRSGKYKQGKGWLRRENSYCCLGVLCDLFKKETGKGSWKEDQEENMFSFKHGSLSEECVLPGTVQTWAGMNSDIGSLGNGIHGSLAMSNDNGKTFSEIADLIEAQKEVL